MSGPLNVESWTLAELISLLAALLDAHVTVTVTWQQGEKRSIQSDPKIGEWLKDSLTATTPNEEVV